MINDQFANMRTWSISLSIYYVACTSAAACAIPGPSSSIMFEQVPPDIRYYSSEVVEATIYGHTKVGDVAGLPVLLLDARIDRVIKGSINTSAFKILLHQSPCGTLFGGHGIILGELKNEPLHGLVLIPMKHWNVR
jgi:hypothetical protein